MHRLKGEIVVIPHITEYGTAFKVRDFEAVLLVNNEYVRFKIACGIKDTPIIGNTAVEAREHLNAIIKNTQFFKQKDTA